MKMSKKIKPCEDADLETAKIFQRKSQADYELYCKINADKNQKITEIVESLDRVRDNTFMLEKTIERLSMSNDVLTKAVNYDKFSWSSFIFGSLVGIFSTVLVWIILKAPICP